MKHMCSNSICQSVFIVCKAFHQPPLWLQLSSAQAWQASHLDSWPCRFDTVLRPSSYSIALRSSLCLENLTADPGLCVKLQPLTSRKPTNIRRWRLWGSQSWRKEADDAQGPWQSWRSGRQARLQAQQCTSTGSRAESCPWHPAQVMYPWEQAIDWPSLDFCPYITDAYLLYYLSKILVTVYRPFEHTCQEPPSAFVINVKNPNTCRGPNKASSNATCIHGLLSLYIKQARFGLP